MEVTIELGDLKTSGSAELRLLQAALPWVGNTLRAPETVMPHDSRLPVSEGSIKLVLPPYSVARLRVPKA
jgi:alpha-L-arabinofuranosidase